MPYMITYKGKGKRIMIFAHNLAKEDAEVELAKLKRMKARDVKMIPQKGMHNIAKCEQCTADATEG